MRKLILLLIIAVAFGQTSYGQDFRFGLTASPTFSFVNSNASQVEGDGLKVGLNYGLLVDYLIGANETYAFSTGLTHHLTGAKLTVQDDLHDTSTTITRSQDLKIQYVEIPLTLRLRTNEIGYMTYYGQFGFKGGFVVSRRYDQEAPPAYPDLNVDNEKNGNVNVLNLGITIGGGLEYNLGGSTSILAGLEYNNGFTNILNDKEIYAGLIDDKVSLRNVTLKVGVLF